MFGIDDFFWMLGGGTYVAAKGIGACVNRVVHDQYIAEKGFNRARQSQLENMFHSTDPMDRIKINRLVGRTVNYRNEMERKLAVREISIREGWQYHDIDEICSDPKYIKMIGGKWPSGKVPGRYYGDNLTGDGAARRKIAETERRKEWTARCPHGDEVDLFPMDFDTEEQYREAVEATIAAEQKEAFYGRYAVYRNSEIKTFVAYQIDVIEGKWASYGKTWSGVRLAAEMCSYIMNAFGGVLDTEGMVISYKILREICVREGIDWDEVMEKSISGDFIRVLVNR